jgi:RNA polymerase sigma-70 factor (ECF subfamily)
METSHVLQARGLKHQEAAAEARPSDLGEAYDAFAAPLYRYLLTFLGSEEDADDALQETFLALARVRLATIRDLQPYLFQAARRQAIAVMRRRRRRDQEMEAAALVSWIDTEACAQEDQTLAIDIDQALCALPPDQREVVSLHLSQGFTFREIAALCGVSQNTATSRYRLAIAKLREALKGEAS